MVPAPKTKKRIVTAAVLTILLLLLLGSTNFGRFLILRPWDTIQLKTFARQIADADRAVATAAGGSATLTFTGAELEKILRAVSSGRSARMPDAVFMSAASAAVSFHLGTNTLGHINMSDQLFSLSGGPQFFDSSTLLKQTIYTPLRQKLNESYTAEMK